MRSVSTPAAEREAATGDTADAVEAAGHFRIYLGAAAGVGKTYAMLNEGYRRKQRGTDVVVGNGAVTVACRSVCGCLAVPAGCRRHGRVGPSRRYRLEPRAPA